MIEEYLFWFHNSNFHTTWSLPGCPCSFFSWPLLSMSFQVTDCPSKLQHQLFITIKICNKKHFKRYKTTNIGICLKITLPWHEVSDHFQWKDTLNYLSLRITRWKCTIKIWFNFTSLLSCPWSVLLNFFSSLITLSIFSLINYDKVNWKGRGRENDHIQSFSLLFCVLRENLWFIDTFLSFSWYFPSLDTFLFSSPSRIAD